MQKRKKTFTNKRLQLKDLTNYQQVKRDLPVSNSILAWLGHGRVSEHVFDSLSLKNKNHQPQIQARDSKSFNL